MMTFKSFLFESCSDDCENVVKSIQNYLEKKYTGLETKKWEKQSGKTVEVIRIDGKIDDRNKLTNDLYRVLKQYFPQTRKEKTSLSSSVETIIIPAPSKDHKTIKVIVKGSTKGSGLGTKETEIYEKYISTLLNRAWKTNKKIEDLDDVPEEFKNNKKWKENFKNITNAIFSKFHDKFKDLEFSTHNENKVVNEIYKKYKEINKREKFFSDVNKWNPADVWGVSKKLTVNEVKKDLKNINSFYGLKEYLQMLIDKGLILPISLKKLNDASKPKIGFVNFKDTSEKFRHIGYEFEQRKPNITDSKDIVIRTPASSDLKLIKFRTFSKGKSFQAEIEGKEAKYGKIGGGVIFKIIEKMTGKKNLVKEYEQILKNIRNANEKEIQQYGKQLYNLAQKVSKKIKGFKNFSMEAISKRLHDRDWLTSKYLALKIVDEIPKNKVNEFVNRLMDYALSQSDYSAPHIKVY